MRGGGGGGGEGGGAARIIRTTTTTTVTAPSLEARPLTAITNIEPQHKETERTNFIQAFNILCMWWRGLRAYVRLCL